MTAADDSLKYSLFLCPRHEMGEGHIEFTLSVCVCLYVPESYPNHNLAIHDGF